MTQALNLRVGLDLAARGFPVFPIVNKVPVTEHGSCDATMITESIRRWAMRHPACLWATLTGPLTRLWVLDVDGPHGMANLKLLCARLGLAQWRDLSPVIVETPSSWFHIWFKLRPGEDPRSRAGDIATGLDTKGRSGSITAPGNMRPDGRGYHHVGTSTDLADAAYAPRGLLYLATLNRRNRDHVTAHPELKRAIQTADGTDWQNLVDQHRDARQAPVTALSHDAGALERQARHDVEAAAADYALLADGRRTSLFPLVCRIGKYCAAGAIRPDQVRSMFANAAAANGALKRHGWPWLNAEIARALNRSAHDAPPPVAYRFRAEAHA